MLTKVRLTQTKIEAHTCPPDKAQAFLWDAAAPGLGVRATAGKRAFIFQGRFAGKSIRMTIGDVDVWTVEQARARARELQGQIDQGRDPREVKREQTAADAKARESAKTNAEPAMMAWHTYIKARASKWSERHKTDHEAMARDGGQPVSQGRRIGAPAFSEQGILRPLLILPLQEITRDRVIEWLDGETKRRPARARLGLSMLDTFFHWCGDQPAYKNQVNIDTCARLKRDLPRPKRRNDCLQREQLAPWFEHVRQIKNPVISAYLQTLLLTGARRSELIGLRWVDVDFQWQTLHIADKVETTSGRTIPLTPHVGQLLQSLPRINDWVFSSERAKNGRLQEPRIAHDKATKAAGLPHLSTHGLRRSFATLSEWAEVPAGVCAQIMGHKGSAIAERHYKRRPVDLLRMWHTKIEQFILHEAGIDK